MRKLALVATVVGLVLWSGVNVHAGSLPLPICKPEQVQVVNPPSKPVPVIGTVEVTNPAENPVPVVVDITQPVTIVYPSQFAAGEWTKTLTGVYKVPSGKRLVIEYISYYAYLPEGEALGLAVLTTPGIPGIYTMLPVSAPAVLHG